MKAATLNELMQAVICDDDFNVNGSSRDVLRILEIALQKKIGLSALSSPARIELGNGHILNIIVEGETPPQIKLPVQEIRREVLAFALLMERRLREKDEERGNSYKSMMCGDLMVRTFATCMILDQQVRLHADAKIRKAVDLANYSMMIVDVAGAL